MFTHHRGRLGDITPRVLFHWFLLSFMAGSINAGAFLACGRFVTHVTGTSTMVGIDFANGNYASGFGMLAIPVFFLLGVMVSAYLVDRRLTEGRSPQYPLVMGLVAGCLLFVSLRGHGNFFGNFGEMAHLRKELLFMALLSIASGLTNAAITTSTGAFVRITHLTGLTTDLGIGLVRVLNMDPSDADYRTERMANVCRTGNFLFFTAGAIAGAFLFVRVDYLGFLLPAALALYAMGLALKSHPLRRVSKA